MGIWSHYHRPHLRLETFDKVLPPSKLSEPKAYWDLCKQTLLYFSFFFSLRWLCHHFSNCVHHECSSISPYAWIWNLESRCGLGCVLYPSMLRARHNRTGAHTHAHKDAACEGVYFLHVPLQFECVHAHFACFPRCVVEFMHLVCVCPCVCVWKRERLYNTYLCPNIPAYDIYVSVRQQFNADVRISISPSGFHFQMGLNFLCPYCLIMTYFDSLSQGKHISSQHYQSS